MNKLILILLMTSFLFGKTAKSQDAFYDASKLEKIFSQPLTFNSVHDASAILANYLSSNNTSDQSIQVQFLSNPFFPNNYKTFAFPAAPIPNNSFPSALAGIGGLDVTNFADGVAKFLVKRFKEELTIAFFQKFEDEISKSAELQTLFPQTYKVLTAINSNIYQFSAYLNTLREAFIKDLTNLYVNFKKFTGLTKYQKYFKDHPEINTVITNGLYLIDQYAAGVHPGDVLANYDTSTLKFKDSVLQNNVRSSVTLIQGISGSFRSVSTEHYWVPADSVRMLLDNNQGSRNIYFGLMYQKYGNISFYKSLRDSVRFDFLLKEAYQNADSLSEYKIFAESFIDHTDEVTEYLSELKGKKKADIDYNDYYNLYNSSLDLLQHAFTFIDLPYINVYLNQGLKDNILLQSNRWLFVARSAGELYVDIRTKNYSSAILNAVGIADTVLIAYHDTAYINSLSNCLGNLDSTLEIKKKASGKKCISYLSYAHRINTIIKDFVNEPSLSKDSLQMMLVAKKITDASVKLYIDSVILTKRLLNSANNESKFTQNILKYGTFAASVAQAQNSDDVEAAIEAIALPSGSYTIKRESKSNISLNAFVGGYAGGEFMPALKTNQLAFSAGLTAPVGVAFSWGGIKCRSNHGGKSFSIFLPLIDVGALAAFRINDDSSKVASEITLANIISPGIYFYWGFGKCPISIGLGGQLGPQLRDITATAADINSSQNYYFRFGLNIAVDIPVLNLSTKSK
jgi:hypothetical protein